MAYVHSSIMVEEILCNLVRETDKYFLDCTLGEGGHSLEILTRFSGVSVYGLDRDAKLLSIARNRLSIFHERFKGFNINFKDVSLEDLELGGQMFDSVLMDLGISVFHYKKSERGFTFSKKEELDMRLDTEGVSAKDIVNTFSEEELKDIFLKFGEERFASRIAGRIVTERAKGEIKYSDELAEIIKKAIPAKFHPARIHPATKCFQALRIAVNDEFENIRIALPKIFSMLNVGGRLGVMTFHSIEDRIVKQYFAELYKNCICPPEVPFCNCGKKRQIRWVVKMAQAGEAEIARNPASRSAKLRIIEKIV